MIKQYRSLENPTNESRKDDILRAAICAFVALTNPTKRDCNQIEDLGLSILGYTSQSTKRFVAAALANSKSAPNALVRRLCDEPTDVCASLLLKSPVLTALDLTLIVGTKGKDYAHIIAQRNHLPNCVIEALAQLNDPVALTRASGSNVANFGEDKSADYSNVRPLTVQEAHARLLAIMAETDSQNSQQEPVGNFLNSTPLMQDNSAPSRLTKLALHNRAGLFVTALADLSGLPFAKVLKLAQHTSPSELSILLRSFGIEAADAFVMCVVFYPEIAANRSSISLFLTKHNNLDVESARTIIRGWKADEISLNFGKKSANQSTLVEHSDTSLDEQTDWEAQFIAS